tara:strand:+ start:73 stop:663 length:591 start_codon:yes stop_codon:yes gene_type:complete
MNLNEFISTKGVNSAIDKKYTELPASISDVLTKEKIIELFSNFNKNICEYKDLKIFTGKKNCVSGIKEYLTKKQWICFRDNFRDIIVDFIKTNVSIVKLEKKSKEKLKDIISENEILNKNLSEHKLIIDNLTAQRENLKKKYLLEEKMKNNASNKYLKCLENYSDLISLIQNDPELNERHQELLREKENDIFHSPR